MISATKTLLLASSVMVAEAAYSPTKANAKTFPYWETSGSLVDYTTKFTDNVLTKSSGELVQPAFAKNGAGVLSGTYQGYRTNKFATAVNQAIPLTDGDAAPVITVLGKGQSFYETAIANVGAFMDASAGTNMDTKTNIVKNTALFGDQFNICSVAKFKDTTSQNNVKACWGLVVASASGANSQSTGIPNRVWFDSTDNAENTLTVGLKETTTMKSWTANQDIILGSLYGAIDTVANKGWCSGAFYNEVASSVTTTAKLEGQTGFGPRGKCTW